MSHLSVRLEGAHPAEVQFLLERQDKRLRHAFVASLVYHIAMIALAFVAIRYGPHPGRTEAMLPFQANSHIVWLSPSGPGGGGGGGGNRMQEPARQAEERGHDKITVPVIKSPKLAPPKQPKDEPNPIEQLNIPAKNLAAAAESLPGAINLPTPPAPSQASGTGGGAGTGSGSGIGSGAGSGLGPGTGGGTGGGAYRPGNGVAMPRLLREVKPDYTSDAMRAKIQGTVLLECLVNVAGEVADVTILRSLDPTFGLDQQAIKAAKQWHFAPGTRLGEPVPVIVSIELSFTLR